jgi:hypothetical protein
VTWPGVGTSGLPPLPEVSEVKRLHLGPGDRLVVTCPAPLSAYELDRLRARLREVFGPDLPVMVLDGGKDVTVVAAEEEAGG